MDRKLKRLAVAALLALAVTPASAQVPFPANVDGDLAVNKFVFGSGVQSIKDSAVALGTSGATLCLQNANCVFSGTVSFTGSLTFGLASVTSLTVTGTAGAGFIDLPSQSTAPGPPAASGVRLYSTNAGTLAWKRFTDGFARILASGTPLTADRTWTFWDASDTVVGLTQAQAITNKTFDASNTFTSLTTTGTAGNGFLEMKTQSVAPAAPASGFRLYGATSGGSLAWIRASDGFTRTLAFGTTTANRTATFWDASDTVVGLTQTQTLTNKTLSGGTVQALTTLGIRSTGTGAFDLRIANAENLTSNRTLFITLNDAARTLALAGNFTTAGSFNTTLTATATTNVTLPTTGTLSTLAGVETLTNKTLTSPTITGATFSGATFTTPFLDVATATSLSITGAAGAGFLDLKTQTSNPASPGGGILRLYGNSAGSLSWYRGADGFIRTLGTGGVLTADRTYTFWDASDTVVGLVQTQTLSNKTFDASNSFTFTSLAPTGTAGAGFLELKAQSAAPSAPAQGFRLYGNASGDLSWRRASDTFSRTLTGAITADRSYTLPDYSATLATIDGAETLSNKSLHPRTLYSADSYVATQIDKNNTAVSNTPLTLASALGSVGDTYGFDIKVFFTADATGGIKLQLGGTGTATSVIAQVLTFCDTAHTLDQSARITALLANQSAVAGCTTGFFTVQGTIVIATTGTFLLRFSQNAASGTSSFLVGSFGRSWRIN